VIDHPQRDEHDREEGERDVEVGDREHAPVLDGQAVPEEAERVDVQDPERAAGDGLGVRRHRLEQL